jgi:hypothetical protein
MAVIHEIVVDCARAPELAKFWAATLDGYAVRAYDAAELARLAERGLTPETDPVVMLDGPGPVVCFQQVPEPTPGKNRLHLDVATADRDAEVARLVALGASIQQEYDGHSTLTDPEGNEFCVVLLH